MYQIARQTMEALYAEWGAKADILRAIPGAGSGPMGLTPDAIKFSPEYIAAHRAMVQSEMDYKKFFREFHKLYKKQYQADLKREREAKYAKSGVTA